MRCKTCGKDYDTNNAGDLRPLCPGCRKYTEESLSMAFEHGQVSYLIQQKDD